MNRRAFFLALPAVPMLPFAKVSAKQPEQAVTIVQTMNFSRGLRDEVIRAIREQRNRTGDRDR